MRSFIYDVFNEKMLLKMLKIAQAPTADDRFNLIARKLAKKLYEELSPSSTGERVSSDTGRAESELKINHLHNLSVLSSFLLNEGIKIDNKQIAYSEQPQVPFIKVNNVFLDKALLTQYIKYLQGLVPTIKAKSENQGRVVELAVNNLINQVNSLVKDSGLSTKKPDETTIDDATILDSFAQKIFDPNYYAYALNGYIKLTAGDIKSAQTLNAWLQKEPEASVMVKGQTKTIPYSVPGANSSDIVQTLYLRAKRKQSFAKSNEEKKNADYYVAQMEKIGPSFKDASGKPWSPGQSSQQGEQEQRTNPNEAASWTGKPGQGGISNTRQSRDFYQIAVELIQGEFLPLKVEDIDLNRIRSWIAKYEQIADDNSKAEIANENQKISQMIQSIGMFSRKQSFELTQNVSEAEAWVDPARPQDAARIAYALYNIVRSTGAITRFCYNQLYPVWLPAKKSELNNLAAQAFSSTSIMGQNSDTLLALLNNIKNKPRA